MQVNIERDLIQLSFASHHLCPHDLVTKSLITDTLFKMNSNSPFDPDLFLQLWKQCQQNSNGRVVVEDFVSVVWNAISLLHERIQHTQKRMKEVLQEREKLSNLLNKQQDYLNKHEMNKNLEKATSEMYLLREKARQLETDRRIIQRLFDTEVDRRKLLSLPEPAEERDQNIQEHLLFTLSLMGTALEILMTFKGKTLLNLFVYSLVFVYYFEKSPPRRLWLFHTCLLLGSIVTDILWGILYGRYLWNGALSQTYSMGLERYSLVLTEILTINKIFVTTLLYLTFRPVITPALPFSPSSSNI